MSDIPTAASAPDSPPAPAPGPLARWWLAVRPRTLPAAASSVIVGSALAAYDRVFSIGPAFAALGIALLLQVGSNLANDVYDHERGADTPDRLGPTRVTQAGLLRPSQVKAGMGVVFALAFVLGLYLVWVRGPLVLLIGIAAIVSAVAYTAGPYPLGYHGLGEVFVFAFFGLVAVAGTYWVQSGSVSQAAWLMAVPVGLLITAILVVNNLRDIEQDRAVGKRTLAVRIGDRGTRIEYALCVALAYALVPVGIVAGWLPVWALVTWLSLAFAYRVTREVWVGRGRSLNAALARTGQLTLVYSLLFAAGIAGALLAR